MAVYEYVTGRAGRAIIGRCWSCGELWHVFTGYDDRGSPAISPQQRQEVADLSRILASVEGLGASGRWVDTPYRSGTGNPRRDRGVAPAPYSRPRVPGEPNRGGQPRGTVHLPGEPRSSDRRLGGAD